MGTPFAMTTEVDSIKGVAAQLILADEATIGVLPGSPQYYGLDVNSFGAFGSTQQLLSRRVLSQRRRRLRGDIVAKDVAADFQVDFTPTIANKLMPSLMQAEYFAQPQHGGVFATTPDLTVTSTGYDIGTGAAAAGYIASHLLFAEGFATAANNGLKTVTALSSDEVQVSGLTAEASPPDAAKITVVGIQFGTGELDVVKDAGNYPTLEIASGILDWTDYQLRPGSRIKIGGTATGDRFNTAANNGHARVRSVSATTLVLDRAPGGADDDTDMSDETGTGKTIKIWLFDQVKDETLDSSLYARNTLFMERRLGEPNPVGAAGEIQAEDLFGMVDNTFAIQIGARDKSFIDLAFLGIDSIEHTGGSGDEIQTDGATILSLPESGFLNNSSHVRRALLTVVDEANGDGAPPPLFNYATQFEIAVSNNAAVLEAVGRATGFDVNTNDFVADVNITDWFTDITTKTTIAANTQCQLEFAWERVIGTSGTGAVVIDFPSGSLGNGAIEVTIDTAMRQTLTFEAAHSEVHDMTMSYNFGRYVE